MTKKSIIRVQKNPASSNRPNNTETDAKPPGELTTNELEQVSGGKASFSEFKITKIIDKSSPVL
jgi:bacteriocin-like protein